MNKKMIAWTLPIPISVLLGLMLLSSCAHIPSEAPELSAELGNRIVAIEKAHINLLHEFFEEKRRQVDEFITVEWIPVFAGELFSDPNIERIWAEVVESNSKEDRLKLLIRLGPKLQLKINEKRVELIEPLDELERLVSRALRDEYDQAKAINNSITSFLISASKVTENRNRYLDKIGITEGKVAGVVNDIDNTVGILLGKAKEAVEKEKVAQEYKDRLESILETLR